MYMLFMCKYAGFVLNVTMMLATTHIRALPLFQLYIFIMKSVRVYQLARMTKV